MTAPFEIDITRANNLIAEWGRIARSLGGHYLREA
jgi:hypothetical protein